VSNQDTLYRALRISALFSIIPAAKNLGALAFPNLAARLAGSPFFCIQV
jgi:hypothetical protein